MEQFKRDDHGLNRTTMPVPGRRNRCGAGAIERWNGPGRGDRDEIASGIQGGRQRDGAGGGGDSQWRGLTVAPEHRCARYDRDDYPYSRSVETRIIASMGGRVYGPYTGRHFASRRETDIEHMVATSEARDSGLCAADAATKRRFAGDVLNLTVRHPW